MTPEYRFTKITFKEKVRSWIISTRPFMIPWIALNTLFGISLAGFNFTLWIVACTISLCILISGHFLNNWRDFVKGIDTLSEGSKEKSYVSSAPTLLPRGMISLRVTKLSTIIFMALGFILMYYFAPLRFDVILLFSIGVFAALTYTDILKPRGFGEIGVFLGHGISATCFAYTMVLPLDMTGISAGILLGFWAGILYTVDQYQDVKTDLGKRIHNLAQTLLKADMKISQLWYFALTGSLVLQMGMVLLGWLPASTLLTVFILILGHIAGIILDADFDKGAIIAIVTLWLYTLIASLGVIFLSDVSIIINF